MNLRLKFDNDPYKWAKHIYETETCKKEKVENCEIIVSNHITGFKISEF